MIIYRILSLATWLFYARGKRTILTQAEKLSQKTQQICDSTETPSASTLNALMTYESELIGALFLTLSCLGCILMMPEWAVLLVSGTNIQAGFIQFGFLLDFVATMAITKDARAREEYDYFNAPDGCRSTLDRLFMSENRELNSLKYLIWYQSERMGHTLLITVSLAIEYACSFWRGSTKELINLLTESAFICSITRSCSATQQWPTNNSPSPTEVIDRLSHGLIRTLITPLLISNALGINFPLTVLMFQVAPSLVYAYNQITISTLDRGQLHFNLANIITATSFFVKSAKIELSINHKIESIINTSFYGVGTAIRTIYDGIVSVLAATSRTISDTCVHSISYTSAELNWAKNTKFIKIDQKAISSQDRIESAEKALRRSIQFGLGRLCK